MRVFADFAVLANWADKLNKVFLATICHKAIKLPFHIQVNNYVIIVNIFVISLT